MFDGVCLIAYESQYNSTYGIVSTLSMVKTP